MCAYRDICNFLEKFLKGWSFVGLDSMGNYGGVIFGWRDSVSMTNYFFVFFDLVNIEVVEEGIHKSFIFFNTYVPYLDKHPY